MAGGILGSLLLEIVTKANTSGLSKTDSSIKKMGRTLQQTSKNASLLSKLSGKLFGGFSFAGIQNAFSSYLQFEKDLGAMHSRFFAITHDEAKATEEFEWIRKVATETANDIKSTADSYSIFSSAVQKSLGQQGARQVFEDWTRVGRVLHLNEYQMERVTYALREMASKGTIYSQDLRMQIGTHVPNAMGLAEKAAKELGITGTDWFDKLQKASKGNAQLTTKFVQLFSKNAREMFGDEEAFKKAMQQPDALAGQIKNFGYNFMIEFSKAGGSYMMVKILNATLDFLKTIDFYSITSTLGKIAKFVGDIFGYMPEILSILKTIAIAYAIQKGIGFGVKAGKFMQNGFWAFKQGKGLSWLLSKMGFKDLAGSIVKGGVKLGTKIGLKAYLSTAVNVIPIIGQILSVVLWIWTAFDLLKPLWEMAKKFFGVNNQNLDTSKKIGDTDISIGRALEIARELSTKGISSPEELKRALGTYGQEALNLQPLFNIQDKNDIKVYINGEYVSASKIEEDKKTEVKKEKGGSWFNKPKNTDIKYNTW